jgi:putative glutamine amidotransferase
VSLGAISLVLRFAPLPALSHPPRLRPDPMGSDAPMIAVSPSYLSPSAPSHPGSPPGPKDAPYFKAIALAGGRPIVIHPRSLVGSTIPREIRGLCLSGGPDVSPSLYGEAPSVETRRVSTDLDAFELRLTSAAEHHGLPILAICRGAQLLNVSRGGTLHQHVPARPSEIAHTQAAPPCMTSHDVVVAPDSKLRSIVGSPLPVNSRHHQAIAALGRGLRVGARAPDDTIEAIEDPRTPFVLGVQWHAERLTRHDRHIALFRAFVRACDAR